MKKIRQKTLLISFFAVFIFGIVIGNTIEQIQNSRNEIHAKRITGQSVDLTMEKTEETQEQLVSEIPLDELVKDANGIAIPGHRFFLIAEGRFVVIYDKQTEEVYQRTEIRMDILPEELKQAVTAGMYLDDERALYDFLETYTS